MIELVSSVTAALYVAMSTFALAVQALAPLVPWHASLALSGIVAAAAAVVAWVVVRRRK